MKQKRAHANKNYNAGAAFEREIRKDFESRGYIATRSAGSHGIFDVWASNGRGLYLIQAKAGHVSAASADKLLESIEGKLKKTFPVITIPIVIFVATGWSEDHKLVGVGRLLLPPKPEEVENAIEQIRIKAEEGRTPGDKV